MKRANVTKIISILLIVGAVSTALSGCGSKSGSQNGEQVVTVQRGDLSIDITGAGNLALSQSEDLAFEVAGYVQEVLVQEGEEVKEGQELAMLDTSDWDKQVKALEKALITAQRNLSSKQSSVTQSERQITSKEFAVRQAELDVQSAQNSLNDIEDIKTIQDNIDDAENYLKVAQSMWETSLKASGTGIDPTFWSQEISNTQDRITKAQRDLQDILDGSSTRVTDDVAMQVTRAQLQLDQANKGLEDARMAVDDAKTAVGDAQLDQEEAQQDLDDAQSNLDEAKGLSPIITAPFDGFITKVNVEGGDEVQKGTVAMTIADPAKFKADIVVGENDIVKVKEGGRASVQVDAIQGLTLPATITHISPTATIQQGVVSYNVTVELDSLQAVGQTGFSRPSLPSGYGQPSGTPRAFQRPGQANSGQTNLNQAGPTQTDPGQTNSNQTDSGQTDSSQTTPSPSSMPGMPAFPAANTQSSQVKDGMSVTVSIIVSESKDVVLVPNQAIIYSGRASQVQVINNGAIEARTIKTGINNWEYTEVTDGLSEGEQVVMQSAGIPASTQTQRQTQPQVPQRVVIPAPGGISSGGTRSR